MNKLQNIKYSFLSATGVFIYVSAISWFFSNAKVIFGNTTEPNFLIPILMLLLFVISASITGLLVLGKPIHLYLSGHKKEAFTLLFSTLVWLVIFLLIVALGLILNQ